MLNGGKTEVMKQGMMLSVMFETHANDPSRIMKEFQHTYCQQWWRENLISFIREIRFYDIMHST
jgi:uncharacterized membrane protein YesL